MKIRGKINYAARRKPAEILYEMHQQVTLNLEKSQHLSPAVRDLLPAVKLLTASMFNVQNLYAKEPRK